MTWRGNHDIFQSPPRVEPQEHVRWFLVERSRNPEELKASGISNLHKVNFIDGCQIYYQNLIVQAFLPLCTKQPITTEIEHGRQIHSIFSVVDLMQVGRHQNLILDNIL